MMTNHQDEIRVFSVTELTQAIKNKLETTFPSVYLKGEMSNVKVQSSGHMYFSLKDAGAQISCVMFRFDLQKVGIPLKEGDTVTVRAELTVYPPRGNYQLVCKELSLSGLGELLIQLEKLKSHLKALGYFDASKKKPLPRFPKTIGVITSPTGAVIQDIIHILSRRLNNFRLILNPVRVQGEGAAEEIAQAIRVFNTLNLADVLIVGRGGGSIEDLMPFNTEVVAKAIFESKIPIISAVGHETDTSIADFVADVRAPTPSGAAEIVSVSSQEVQEKLTYYRHMTEKLLRRTVSSAFEKIAQLKKQPLFTHPLSYVSQRAQALDNEKEALEHSLRSQFSGFKQRLKNATQTIQVLNPQKRLLDTRAKLLMLKNLCDTALLRSVKEKRERFLRSNFSPIVESAYLRKLDDKKNQLKRLQSTLNALNPKNILAKGYSIAFREKDHHVVHAANEVSPGDKLQIHLHEGKLTVEVVDIL